jgi:hypothetical protein
MLRISHRLKNCLTDGGEVVNFPHWPRSTAQKWFCFCFWYSFIRCWLNNLMTSSGLEPAVFTTTPPRTPCKCSILLWGLIINMKRAPAYISQRKCHLLPQNGVNIQKINLFVSVRFEFFTTVTMKNVVFWDVTPWGSCKNRRFGETLCLLHQGDKKLVFLCSVLRLLVTANVLSSPSLVTLIKEALSSSETSVSTRATRLSLLALLHVSVCIL